MQAAVAAQGARRAGSATRLAAAAAAGGGARLGTQCGCNFRIHRRGARRLVLPLHFRGGICGEAAGAATQRGGALGLWPPLRALRSSVAAWRSALHGAPLKSHAACTAGAGASAPPSQTKDGLSAARGFAALPAPPAPCAAAAGAMPAAMRRVQQQQRWRATAVAA